MKDSYLEVADAIIRSHGRPMSAQEIIGRARKFGLMPEHLSGATMEKTLQARISEHIYRHRRRSRFYRTGQGVYFLRSLSNDDTLPIRAISEHPIESRRQPHSPGHVLYIRMPTQRHDRFIIEDDVLDRAIVDKSKYFPLGEAPFDYFAMAVFPIIRIKDRYLSFRIGPYSHFVEWNGLRSLGFRRFIDEFDVDLIDQEGVGVLRSTVRSCSRYISLREMGLNDVDFIALCRRRFAVVDPHSKMAGIIVEANLDSIGLYATTLVRRLDVSDYRWTSMNEFRSDQYDPWSRIVHEQAN